MGFIGRLLLITGLLAEALLFAGVVYAQIPPAPVPTPAPQPQTIIGRELAAGAQILSDASNNVNALALLVIAASVVTVILSVVMIIVLKGILDDKKRSDAATVKREEAERREKVRSQDHAAESITSFTHAVNTFSVVSAGIARLETGIDALNKDRTDSKRQTQERDAKYFERIDTVETRMVDGLNAFGDRLAHEIPAALREGQVQAAQQAAQLLLDKLPDILAQVTAPAQAATPSPDAVDHVNIKADHVNISHKNPDKGEIS